MIEDEGVSLAELKADACRWPVAMGTDGEWRFCAAPIDKAAAGRFPGGVSYCSEHLARAYVMGRPVRENWIERPVEIEHAERPQAVDLGFDCRAIECGGAMPNTIRVNGIERAVDVDGDTPLLWVLRDVLGLTGTK